jgi:O-antigen ligase
LALWAAWSALTLLWSLDPDWSAKEFRNEVIYAVLAFWMCYVAAQARGALRVIASVVAAGSALACGIAIYHFAASTGHYPGGMHGGPGSHSSVLLTLMPCALLAAWHGARARIPWLLLLGSALALLYALSAYTTLNRTVWIGLVIEALVIFALLGLRRGGSTDRRPIRIVGAALVVLAAGAVALAAVHAERQALQSAVPVKQDPRLRLWPEAGKLIAERPLQGYGFGRGLMRAELAQRTGDSMLWHSHNLFVDTALQAGIPGLLLLVALLACTVRHGWAASRTQDALARACGIVLVAVVAGMLARNMTDVLWVRHVALLYWGAAGMLLALSQRSALPADT